LEVKIPVLRARRNSSRNTPDTSRCARGRLQAIPAVPLDGPQARWASEVLLLQQLEYDLRTVQQERQCEIEF
jgi:hypothetical protein